MQIKVITPYRQLACLRRNYPDGKVIRQWKDGWAWTSVVQPRPSRPSSPHYNFKIVYNHNRPEVYALDQLELADGEIRLPHIYSQQRQRLCLYLPNGIEWNATMPVAKIVPWVAKWFYFYESWVVTGIWSGGGIHVTDDAYQQIHSSRTKRRHNKRKSPK